MRLLYLLPLLLLLIVPATAFAHSAVYTDFNDFCEGEINKDDSYKLGYWLCYEYNYFSLDELVYNLQNSIFGLEGAIDNNANQIESLEKDVIALQAEVDKGYDDLDSEIDINIGRYQHTNPFNFQANMTSPPILYVEESSENNVFYTISAHIDPHADSYKFDMICWTAYNSQGVSMTSGGDSCQFVDGEGNFSFTAAILEFVDYSFKKQEIFSVVINTKDKFNPYLPVETISFPVTVIDNR